MTKENGTVISEIYDLLNPSAYIKQDGDDFILSLPSANSNLSEVRFRSFNPIVSRDILNSDRLTSEVRIEPVICKIDEHLEVSTAYLPDYLIHNEKGNLRLPIKGATYTVEFNGDLDALIKDVNDAIAGYCEDFDWDGWFTFCKPDGSDPHHLQKETLKPGEPVNYSEAFNKIARIRTDKGNPELNINRFLYQRGTQAFIGTPDNPQLVDGVTISGDLLFTDALTDTTTNAFNYITTTGVYFHDNSNANVTLLEKPILSYASKTNGDGIVIAEDGTITRFKNRIRHEITTEFKPSAVMYVSDRYLMTTEDGKVYNSTNDGTTWTLLFENMKTKHTTYALTFGPYLVFISSSEVLIFDENLELKTAFNAEVFDAAVIGDFLMYTTAKSSYKVPLNTLTPEFMNDYELTDIVLNNQYLTTYKTYLTVSVQFERCTIREYYTQLVKQSNVLTPTATFSSLNHDLTVMNLCFNLGDYVLMFVIDVIINPLDLINMSSFYQVFNATANLKTSFVIYNNNCITVSKNFDKNLMRASYLYGGKTLTLACNQATNKSKKIYTDSENGRVYFKYFKASGSVPALVVYMLDKDNRKISLDYLSAIYDQIIVEIDYIYN